MKRASPPVREVLRRGGAARTMTRLAGWMCVACLASPVFAQALTLQDDAGRAISLRAPARRIISLAPSITELLYAAGGGERLVATAEFSDYPPAARKLPRIGTDQRLDLERIVALKPDLVLAWRHGNPQRELDKLTALGIPLFAVEPRRIEDIAPAIERLGRLAGTAATADTAASRFRERLAALRVRHAHATRVRVFYQVWTRPLLTINGEHLISDVLSLCGGNNVFAGQALLVPQLSTESVLAAEPQVIFTARMSETAGDTAARRDPDADAFEPWKPFAALPAVKSGQLWTVPGDLISRPGPRILDGVQAVCDALDGARRGSLRP